MNHSIYSADRATHLKIVIVALLAAFVGLGLPLHFDARTVPAATTAVLEAGGPVVVSSSADAMVR